MRKIFISLFALIMCLPMLFSCASNDKATVMSVESGENVSVNFLYLLTSIQKSMYSDMVNSYGGDWETVVNEQTGETFSDILYDLVLNSAKSSLICEYLHDNVYGLSLTDEQNQSIDNQIQSMEKNYGSKELLEEQLSKYSADIETLKRYFELSIKQANLYNAFYGESGVHKIADEQIMKYFEYNYSVVTHIYFNTVSKVKPDGTAVSLTDEEKAQKESIAKEVYNRILAGEDFFELRTQYSEDAYESEYYPNGFFVTYDTAFPTDFTVASMEMQVGDTRYVDSDGSGVHIIRKLPMNAQLYNSDQTVYLTIKQNLCGSDFDQRIAQYFEIISIDQEQLSKLLVNVVPAFGY